MKNSLKYSNNKQMKKCNKKTKMNNISVLDPDGKLRIVKYTVDKDSGFQAKVITDGHVIQMPNYHQSMEEEEAKNDQDHHTIQHQPSDDIDDDNDDNNNNDNDNDTNNNDDEYENDEIESEVEGEGEGEDSGDESETDDDDEYY